MTTTTRKRRAWTTLELKRLFALRDGGLKLTVIARHLGRPVSSVGRRLRRSGYEARRSGGPRLRDVRGRLEALAGRGLSAPDIAARLGTHPGTVRGWAARLGLRLTPAGGVETFRRRSEASRRRAAAGGVSIGELAARLRHGQAAALGWPQADCPGHARALQALREHPGGLTAEQLAPLAGYALCSARALVRLLAGMGLVEEAPGRRFGGAKVWLLCAWLRNDPEAA